MHSQEFMKKYYFQNIAETKRKIRESVSNDNLIIQCISNIDDLDKAANLLSKRLRDWYSLQNPELCRNMQSHEKLAAIISQKTDRKEKDSMGSDLKPEDAAQARKLANEITSLYDLRKSHEHYLEGLMKRTAPNMTAVAGYMVGAKLIAHAGTLKRLSIMTSSTVQILGAEKALFRHMKTGARAPKHGLILQHQLLQKAKSKDRGRVARLLADKISMASKIDYFKGKFIGDRLHREILKKVNN